MNLNYSSITSTIYLAPPVDIDNLDKDDEVFVLSMKVTQTDMSHVNCTNNYTRIVYKVLSVNEYTPVFTSNSSSIELPEDIQIPFTNATVRFIFLFFLIVVNKKSFLVYILPGLCLISSISEE